jgi:hypothetical protein
VTKAALPERSLLLVYNADSGFFNALTDSVHKLFSPSTYNCQLCALTYGAAQMRREWALFLRKSPHPVRFLHRDEFRSQFPAMKTELPAVFSVSGGGPSLLIGADEIKQCKSLNDLEELLQSKAYGTTGYA